MKVEKKKVYNVFMCCCFVCIQVVAFVLALLVAAKYLYIEKDESIASEVSSPHNIKEAKKARLIIGLKGKKRIRRATFTCGDNDSIDEEINDTETSKECVITEELDVTLEETMDTKISPKKRSFSFTHHIPKWKRSHSFNDSLKTTVKDKTPRAASAFEKSNNSKENRNFNIPSVKVSEHQDVMEKPVMFECGQSTGPERRNCRDGVRTVEECKKIMKEPVSIIL